MKKSNSTPIFVRKDENEVIFKFKYFFFICSDKQRKDQMEKHLQNIQATIEENILNQPDCADMLKNFFDKREKFMKENKEKVRIYLRINVLNIIFN